MPGVPGSINGTDVLFATQPNLFCSVRTQDDVLPMRLKTVLMRILTTEGSTYRAKVDELLLQASTQASASASASFTFRFATKMESIASDLERSAQRLGDKVQALPFAAEQGNRGGGGLGAGEWSGTEHPSHNAFHSHSLLVVQYGLRRTAYTSTSLPPNRWSTSQRRSRLHCR